MHADDCRDIFTATTDGRVCAALKDLLVEHVQTTHPDVEVIVGLDARGFLFGFMLAAELGIAFVPIRKKGKLPGLCHSHQYKSEYGSDTFEIQADSIKAGQKVVIVDDLLATGGTLASACHLIAQSGGVVQEIVVLLELLSLRGRDKLDGKSVYSFIKYD